MLAGVSPYDDFTPQELMWMAKAKAIQEWNHTSCLLALIHNVNSKRKRKPEDFHPFARDLLKGGARRQQVTLENFKAVLAAEKKGSKHVSGNSGKRQSRGSVCRHRS